MPIKKTTQDQVGVVLPAAEHPIIAGFNPDPSVCVVDGTYYLVTSSFEYRPGVPIYRSEDLLSWTHIGHVLSRPSQMREDAGTGSSGIYAPTLRHHGDRFWMITTNVTGPRPEQLIVHSKRPDEGWSDPVYTHGANGIDPDLSWDGNDCYLTWSQSTSTDPAIMQMKIDPFSARTRGDAKLIWRGTGMQFSEAPHLYCIGDWWYLMVAEGGTERGHSISIARSRAISGPFEPCPNNPILSHRSLSHPVQNTGHGDLVRQSNGDWALVYLGVRPRGTSPWFHANGRETFLAGVRWEQGWPIVDVNRHQLPQKDLSFEETFDGRRLDSRWVSPGRFPSSFSHLRPNGGVVIAADEATRMLVCRVTAREWNARISLRQVHGTAIAILRMDEHHWCGVEIEGTTTRAMQSLRGARLELGAIELPVGGEVMATITARFLDGENSERLGPDIIRLGVEIDGRQTILGEVDGRYVSTEVAGGFTGRMIGAAVTRGEAVFDGLSYVAETA